MSIDLRLRELEELNREIEVNKKKIEDQIEEIKEAMRKSKNAIEDPSHKNDFWVRLEKAEKMVDEAREIIKELRR